jgi:hypothetical protein
MDTGELLALQTLHRTWVMGSSCKHTMPTKDARMPILWVWTARCWSFRASGMYIYLSLYNITSEIDLKCKHFSYDDYVLMWCRPYVEVEQNIVKNAGSTSNFANGLDMKSSSIQMQVLMLDVQGNFLNHACRLFTANNVLIFLSSSLPLLSTFCSIGVTDP